MENEQKSELNKLFEGMVDELELPTYILDNLKTSYEALGDVLNADDNDALKGHKVVVHYQGSIGLGTAIRPQNENDDVDVDMVCEVHGILGWTQKKLKHAVGDRLKSRETYRRLLDDEGTRCWKLRYRQNSDRPADRYHVDILPATVSNGLTWDERVENFSAANPNWNDMMLYITDNKRPDYATSIYFWDWLKSNPLAYRLWFEMQCHRDMFTTKSIRASVDPFPTTTTKTILQKVVMLLKRHRDVRYGGSEDKPISCIITTLAARAYQGEKDIASALSGIASRMRQYIKGEAGHYRIENPVNPNENFADKWETHPSRQRIFFEWLSEIERDYGRGCLLDKPYIERTKGLTKSFGDIVTRAVNKIDTEMREAHQKGMGGITKKAGILTIATSGSTYAASASNFFGTGEK